MKPSRPTMIVAALLASFIAAITIFIRVPIPKSGGYLNLGDVVVIFAGLYLGPRYGFIVGAVGSAVADAVGFPVFIIPTFFIKGLEGALAGAFQGRLRFIGPLLGALTMVAGYYVAEAFVFSGKIGRVAAIAELPFNLLQGGVGVLGGFGIYALVTRWSNE